MEKYTVTLCSIVALLVISLFFLSCSGTRPPHVGKQNLAPCPQTPNCVSTHSTNKTHAIDPLTYSTDHTQAMDQLVAVIKSMKRTKIITRTETYLYVEFTTALWRFVDDVEFQFDTEKKLIHFRSASRLGKGDLGVNRDRMESVRHLFIKSNK